MKDWLRKFALFRMLGHWRWFVFYLFIPVWRAKLGYRKSLRRVREKFGRQKLKVVFVVGQTSKWKCQSVYDLMKGSSHYDPVIALVICDFEQGYTREAKAATTAAHEEYFRARGMKCVRGYSPETGRNIPLRELDPDLVFYSQPWYVDECQCPYAVADRALTFYVPYYVTNLESVSFSCGNTFVRSVFGYITLNAEVASVYRKAYAGLTCAARYLGLGHPALDVFRSVKSGTREVRTVIYAPHWSIDHPGNLNVENYSTFLETGMPILTFAESHPEIRWVFKPHPTLRSTLKNSGAWKDDAIDLYYRRWEKLGVACYDGSYIEYFKNSDALITDCGSFLVEYACTGNPIIHLISPTRKVFAQNGLEKVFDTYYQSCDAQDLYRLLQEVVLDSKDPKRGVRMAAIRAAGLCETDAAAQVVKYLEDLLAGEK